MEAPHATEESWKSGKSSSDDQLARVASDAAHEREFTKYAGMSPKWCYRLVLASTMLRLASQCWVGMIVLEFGRFYVTNDLGLSNTLRAFTVTPQYALQALFFPFWGVVADRVSRKKVLVTASLAACCSQWLMTLIPSVKVYVIGAVLEIVANVGVPIRDAMLRDMFSTGQWERTHGGVTGLKARIYAVGQGSFMAATAVGLLLLQLGKRGIGLPNEYQLHKPECGETYCLDPDQETWVSRWQLSGCLRLLHAMSSVLLTVELCVVAFAYPETLRPEFRDNASIRTFIKSRWWELARPWNNLRVLATPLLRRLMGIRFLSYIMLAGWSANYLSFYGRFEFDTSTIVMQTLAVGIVTWLTTMAVPRLVDRFGDLRGVWIPQLCFMFLFVLSAGLLPPGYGNLVYVVGPLFAGPFTGLSIMAQELLPKLVPADLQATYQTANTFMSSIAFACTTALWNLLYVKAKNLAYPWDGLPLFVSLAINVLMLFSILLVLPYDPRRAIMEGKALEAFWQTSYVKSKWYRYHSGGSDSSTTHLELQGAISVAPGRNEAEEVAAPAGDASVAKMRDEGGMETAEATAKPKDTALPDNVEMECRV